MRHKYIGSHWKKVLYGLFKTHYTGTLAQRHVQLFNDLSVAYKAYMATACV